MSEMAKSVGSAVRSAIANVAYLDDSMDEIIGRAVIEAMREPTDNMCENAKPHGGSRYEIWLAMIDEALNPSQSIEQEPLGDDSLLAAHEFRDRRIPTK